MAKLASGVLLFLLCPFLAFGQVTCDEATNDLADSATDTTGPTVQIASLEFPAGNNRALIVGASSFDNVSPTRITGTGTDWNSTESPFTEDIVETAPVVNEPSILHRVGVTATTANVDGDTEAAPDNNILIIALPCYGIDQASPIGDSDNSSGTTGTSCSHTLTSTSGDMAISVISIRATVGNDPNPQFTAGTQVATVNVGRFRVAMGYRAATGSSVAIGWDTFDNPDDWGCVSILLTQAVGNSIGPKFIQMSTP